MSSTAGTVKCSITAGDAPAIYGGRWERTSSGGLLASWATCSITLHFTGSLGITAGPKARRIDRANLASPMIVWTIGELRVEPSGPVQGTSLRPGKTTSLFSLSDKDGPNVTRVLRLWVADWDATVDLAAFVVDSETSLKAMPSNSAEPSQQNKHILVIGDSISCAYTMGPEYGFEEPVNGAYDAYPLVLERTLQANGTRAMVECVAYPGIRLADFRSRMYGGGDGMETKFWQKSMWSKEEWDPKAAPGYHDPSTIIFALGANDDGQGIPAEEFVSSMVDFFERLSAVFSPTLKDIVVLGPFHWISHGCSRLEPAVAQAVATLQANSKTDMPRVHHVSVQDWLTPDLAPDDVHPSIEGNQAIAERLFEKMQNDWL